MQRNTALAITKFFEECVGISTSLGHAVNDSNDPKDIDLVKKMIGSIYIELTNCTRPAWKEYPDLEPTGLKADRATPAYKDLLAKLQAVEINK